MIRATALSILLALAVGPNALLCRTWCDQPAASGCHEEDSLPSPGLTRDDTCQPGALIATFVREDVRRGDANPNPGHAVLVSRDAFLRSTTDAGQGAALWRHRPPGHRSPTTTLRI